MSLEVLKFNIDKHFNSIDLCLNNDLHMPALILIYTGIDIFANLSRPADKESGTRDDFKKWSSQYLFKNSELSCRPIDLYAARCSILHTYTAESNLSKKNEACELVYAYGNKLASCLQKLIDESQSTDKAVHIETLSKAFKEGVNNYILDVSASKDNLDLVTERANKFFNERPDLSEKC